MDTLVVVAGLNGSGPEHWQSRWLRERPGAVLVEQRDWDQPDREEWVAALDDTVRAVAGPVVLVAHSLGCHTVAHWAHRHDGRVRAALLVAPPDIASSAARGAPIAGFGPAPTDPLPFPAVLAASTTDPWSSLEACRLLAAAWGARFVDLGDAGHVNVAAGFGPWPRGEELLAEVAGA